MALVACGSPQPKSEDVPAEKQVDTKVENPVSGPEAATLGAQAGPPIDTASIEKAPLAQPPLTLRFREGWNQHHDFGASGMHLNSEVVIYLHQGGGVRVTDSGEHRTSELSNQWGYQEEKKVWDNAWHGTWKTEADKLILVLSPTKHECKLHVTDYGDQKSVKDCPEIPAVVHLECPAQQIDVKPEPLSRDEDKLPRKVWVCFPEEGAEAMGGSPTSWVLAEGACLRVSTGFRGKGRSFSVCGEVADQNGANPPVDQ